MKELCIIKSVINNTDHLIRLYADARIRYVHCVLPNTHEPIIYFNRFLYNTIIFDEYIEENIKECQITSENNLKDFERLRNTTVQEFKRRLNIQRNEISQNEVILYTEYAYSSDAPLVLYTDDIEFTKLASWNKNIYIYKLNIQPRIIKSIKKKF